MSKIQRMRDRVVSKVKRNKSCEIKRSFVSLDLLCMANQKSNTTKRERGQDEKERMKGKGGREEKFLKIDPFFTKQDVKIASNYNN